MINKTLLFVALFSFLSTGYATIYPEANPCNPSPYGTYCEIHPKVKKSKKYKNIAYCGNQYIYLTNRQKRALDAYLRENRNMILRFKVDNEYIDAPCF